MNKSTRPKQLVSTVTRTKRTECFNIIGNANSDKAHCAQSSRVV